MKKRLPVIATICLLVLACSSKHHPDPEPDPPPPPPPDPVFVFAKGADVSWITEMESAGKKFYSKNNMEMEGMALLKSLGMNTVRLRVWVNPSPPWNNAADVVAKAVRAKNLGMRVMIDFHYSDSWADPGQQKKPAAWVAYSLTQLKTAVGTHTTEILNHLKTAGVTPEWVQIGNETDDGLLWPDGRASTNMSNYSQLINAGYDAVKGVFPDTKVIVHVSNGWNNDLFTWNIGGLVTYGTKFDVIGMSLYPSYVAGGWATANQQCLANMNDMIARYRKPVMIVEVGMPWDDAANCKSFLTDLIAKTKSIPNNNGLGVLYWEPLSYGNWNGYTLGAFDNAGKPTVALDAFAD